jgi:hypothetical protein
LLKERLGLLRRHVLVVPEDLSTASVGSDDPAQSGDHADESHADRLHPSTSVVRRTLRISCEAVPPSILPAGAQGGTSARRSGAALSFVSCIRLLGSPLFERRCFAAAEWAALSFGETISD